MNERKTIKVNSESIKKARKAGAKIVSLWITSFGAESYEGRKRKGSNDHLYGVKAICDNVDLLCLKRAENKTVTQDVKAAVKVTGVIGQVATDEDRILWRWIQHTKDKKFNEAVKAEYKKIKDLSTDEIEARIRSVGKASSYYDMTWQGQFAYEIWKARVEAPAKTKN